MINAKVYIAAPWVEKDGLVKEVRDKLVNLGFVVTSRWIDFPGNTDNAEILAQEADNDWDDVERADILLLLNLQPRGSETSGKAVETGIALANGLAIYMVGKPSNVFHYIINQRFDTVDEAIEAIKSDWEFNGAYYAGEPEEDTEDPFLT